MILDFIYPRFCLHCETKLRETTLFCGICAAAFELTDARTHCPYCYEDQETGAPCAECIDNKRFGVRMAAACDYIGPVATLVNNLKYGKLMHLAATAASFLFLQLERLQWPRPDWIVPIPKRSVFQRYNHAHLIAKELAKKVGIPVAPFLGRAMGDLPQGTVQRELNFYLRKKGKVHDQVILLVDDVIFSGDTFRKAAAVLSGSFPKKIYALAFAISE